MKNLTQLEEKKIQSVANQYKKDGYDVILDADKMPEFLKGMQVDMVALSDSENVLIEVVSRVSVKDREKLEHLAKIVYGREKWRFELIVTNPKDELQQDISLLEIVHRIEESKYLINKKLYFAAIMLAWSATEAVMRALAEREGIKSKTRSPIQLTKTLYSLRAIGKSTYEILMQAAKLRNNIAHGYQIDSIAIDSKSTTIELIRKTSELMEKISEGIHESEEQLSANDLVEWFYEHYEDPANGVPYESKEGGYIYIYGGPYDPWEVLADQFPEVEEDIIEEAASRIYPNGHEWIEKGQY